MQNSNRQKDKGNCLFSEIDSISEIGLISEFLNSRDNFDQFGLQSELTEFDGVDLSLEMDSSTSEKGKEHLTNENSLSYRSEDFEDSGSSFPFITQLLCPRKKHSGVKAQYYIKLGKMYIELICELLEMKQGSTKETGPERHNLDQIILQDYLIEVKRTVISSEFEAIRQLFLSEIGHHWQSLYSFVKKSLIGFSSGLGLQNQIQRLLTWQLQRYKRMSLRQRPVQKSKGAIQNQYSIEIHYHSEKTFVDSEVNTGLDSTASSTERQNSMENSKSVSSSESYIYNSHEFGQNQIGQSSFNGNFYDFYKEKPECFHYNILQVNQAEESFQYPYDYYQTQMLTDSHSYQIKYDDETSFLSEESQHVQGMNEGNSQLKMNCSTFYCPKQKTYLATHSELNHSMEIHHYLNSLRSATSEINLLSQQMSLPYTEFRRQRLGGKYRVTATLSFVCKYLNNTPKCYNAVGMDYNLRRANAKAAREILERVYSQVPQMWKDFVKIKNRKGLTD